MECILLTVRTDFYATSPINLSTKLLYINIVYLGTTNKCSKVHINRVGNRRLYLKPGRGRGYSQKNWVSMSGCASRFSKEAIPYLWPDPKFDTLFITVAAGTVALNIIHEGFWLMVCLMGSYETRLQYKSQLWAKWPKSIPKRLKTIPLTYNDM